MHDFCSCIHLRAKSHIIKLSYLATEGKESIRKIHDREDVIQGTEKKEMLHHFPRLCASVLYRKRIGYESDEAVSLANVGDSSSSWKGLSS